MPRRQMMRRGYRGFPLIRIDNEGDHDDSNNEERKRWKWSEMITPNGESNLQKTGLYWVLESLGRLPNSQAKQKSKVVQQHGSRDRVVEDMTDQCCNQSSNPTVAHND